MEIKNSWFLVKIKITQDVFIRIKSTDLIISKIIPKDISALNFLNLKLNDYKILKDLVTLYFNQ